MVAKNKTKTSAVCRLDSKRYADKLKRAGRVADKALERYGEPTISLAELRTALDRQLRGISLSDTVLKDREAGW